MIILRGNTCQHRLTSVLTEATEVRDYSSVQDEEFFGRGQFYENHAREEGFYLLHVSDCVGLKNHGEISRFSGCCGPSPDGQLNKICFKCKAEIGRETTDCLTPHYTKIRIDKVCKEEDSLGFFNLLCHIISARLGRQKLEEIESIYQYSSKSIAFEMLVDELISQNGDLPEGLSIIIKR